MTDLSPQAQAVRDAFDTASIDTSIFGDPDRRLASALRAAADQLSRSKFIYTPNLLAIAAELESSDA
jgi:hypothetical protein